MKNLAWKCLECWNAGVGVDEKKNATPANQCSSSTNDRSEYMVEIGGQGFSQDPHIARSLRGPDWSLNTFPPLSLILCQVSI